MAHKDVHIILTIPPNTIEYNPTLEWPQYLHTHEPDTTILCIHNQRIIKATNTYNIYLQPPYLNSMKHMLYSTTY